jgi:hypothetical protein
LFIIGNGENIRAENPKTIVTPEAIRAEPVAISLIHR